MKTIALTLLVAAAVFAQSNSAATSTAAKDKNKTANTDATKKPQKASQQKAVAQKPPAKAEPPVQTIPAGAVQVESNLYRYTDSNGKTWNYRQTPFGINKWEQSATPETQPAPAPTAQTTSQSPFRSAETKTEPITVTDLGDRYQFDKNTPFGHTTWVRKKSEVTKEERALIAAQQSDGAASKPAGN